MLLPLFFSLSIFLDRSLTNKQMHRAPNTSSREQSKRPTPRSSPSTGAENGLSTLRTKKERSRQTATTSNATSWPSGTVCAATLSRYDYIQYTHISKNVRACWVARRRTTYISRYDRKTDDLPWTLLCVKNRIPQKNEYIFGCACASTVHHYCRLPATASEFRKGP